MPLPNPEVLSLEKKYYFYTGQRPEDSNESLHAMKKPTMGFDCYQDQMYELRKQLFSALQEKNEEDARKFYNKIDTLKCKRDLYADDLWNSEYRGQLLESMLFSDEFLKQQFAKQHPRQRPPILPENCTVQTKYTPKEVMNSSTTEIVDELNSLQMLTRLQDEKIKEMQKQIDQMEKIIKDAGINDLPESNQDQEPSAYDLQLSKPPELVTNTENVANRTT